MSKLTEYKVVMSFQDPTSEVKEVSISVNTIHLEEHEILNDETKEAAIDLILEGDTKLKKEHLKSVSFNLVE